MFKWLLSLLWVRPPKLQLNGHHVEGDHVIRPRRHLIDFGAKVQVPSDPLERQRFEELLMEKLAAGFDVFEQGYAWNARIAARTWNLVLFVTLSLFVLFHTQILGAIGGMFQALPMSSLAAETQPVHPADP